MKRYVNVKNQYEGIHFYGDAPEEVAYLRQPHRHQFMVYSQIEVKHDDRDIEFIMMQHKINKWFQSQAGYNADLQVWDMGYMSCEMVAESLIKHLQTIVGCDRDIQVSVYEDDENGATVTFTKEEV